MIKSLLLGWAGLASLSAFAIQQAPVKLKFSTAIPTPTMVQVCAGSLWSNNLRKSTLVRLNPSNGAILSETAFSKLGIGATVIALGCAKENLLVATQARKSETEREYRLYRLPIPMGKPSAAQAVTAPGKGLIRDVFCAAGSTECYLIRDKVYRTQNLSAWKEADLPSSREIAKTELSTEENPFANWQDKFIVANGQYFRGGFIDDKSVFLLDPFRTSIAVLNPAKPEDSRKFGRWGVWEGRLMSPKGITLLANGFFAVSDVGLKLVFLFNQEGNYVGTFGADGASSRFKYPLELSSQGNTVFVADVSANKVLAYDVLGPSTAASQLHQLTPETRETLSLALRQNLFRDAEVLDARVRTRCLSCHDGLVINSIDKFMDYGKHHPVNVSMKAGAKIDLPLENGVLVTCSSCHDAHHGVGEPVPGTKAVRTPYMLRKPVLKLCMSCHEGQDRPESNHVAMDAATGCTQCHTMHVAQDYLLKEKLPDLCVNCHGKEKIPSAHPFSPDTVTCVSCHSLHKSSPKLSFATHSITSGATCLMCHEDKKELLGKSIHMGTEPMNEHKWPKDEGTCLDCHNPHAAKKPVQQVCSQCHSMTGTHPAPITGVTDTPAAKGIILEGTKLSCMTCHEPHGSTPPNEKGRQFFRPAAKIMEFCATCHGDGASELYQQYHGRVK